ncbi:FecR family protein [Peristeroidobacter soli]|uniref:FecR family protein n=1 Tax=Peristeroidobacter soli TaxID=2497877 RepID=UPI00101B67AA|nr:FecR domain-containing protein [Peristeroidobacter soli]
MSGLEQANPSVDSVAREWVLKLASGHATAEDTAGVRAWLAESPTHRSAFKRAKAVWHDARNVEHKFQTKPASRRYKAPLLAAAALAGILLVPILGHLWVVGHADYHSPLGQVNEVALPDGSTVWLDTGAAIDISFTDQRRDVSLLKGRAFFAVAPDSSKPFRVEALGGSATAVGTAYSVALERSGVSVAVEEGHVRIAKGASEVTLAAGMQGSWSEEGQLSAQTGEDETTDSWRHGRLIVNDRPLAELIDQLDRYHRGVILLRDRGEVHVSGQFDLRRTDQALQALALSQGLHVSNWTPWLTVLSR